MDTLLAVMIPCYNEELTVGKVISDLKNKVSEAKLYVFDNNSTEKTAEIAKAAALCCPVYVQ